MPNKVIFGGQQRAFFLLLAFAFLAQAALFMQSRLGAALELVGGDFKIAVVLDNASPREAAEFRNALRAFAGVVKVSEIDLRQTIDAAGGSVVLNPDFLPVFFEVKVNDIVMLNPKVWVQNNIASMDYDAAAYYKEDQAKLAVYINAAARFVNILLIACVFCLLAFGFFVEAYYTRISTARERLGGVLAGVFACAVAFGAAYILAQPADIIYPSFVYDMFCWRQGALLSACLLTGWTLAKWKRF
jgi:hypothetical protein